MDADTMPPPLAADVILPEHPESDGRYVVELATSGRTFLVKPTHYTILTHLQRRDAGTLEELAEVLARENGIRVSPGALEGFIQRMGALGILGGAETAATTGAGQTPRGTLQLRLERWDRALGVVSNFFFGALSGPLWAALAGASTLAALWFWRDAYVTDLRQAFAWPGVFVAFLVIYLVTLPLLLIHEVGHELAARKLFGTSFPMRISLLPIGAAVQLPPAAPWRRLTTAHQRVVLALAGAYLQLFASGALLLTWHATGGALFVGRFCVIATIPALCTTILTLMPAMPGLPERKTDGYFAISYAIGLPNLALRLDEYRSWHRAQPPRRTPPAWLAGMSPRGRGAVPLVAYSAPWLDPAVRVLIVAALALLFWPVPVSGPYITGVFALLFAFPYLTGLFRFVAALSSRRPQAPVQSAPEDAEKASATQAIEFKTERG
jgi:hypothetical protein